MHELGLQVRKDGPTMPFAGVAVDPIRTKGYYAYAGVQHDEPVGKATVRGRLNVGASAYDMMPASLQDVTAQLTGIYPLGGGAYVSASGFAAYAGRDQKVYPWMAVSVGVAR
jgi:hypothetical protein